MPSAESILDGLSHIANTWRGLAMLWHVYFGAAVAALALGARPSKGVTALVLALPLLSVSGLAWSSGNPFNGTTFAGFGLGAIAIASRLPSRPVTVAPQWLSVPGALLVAFGWVYPHFLETTSATAYLYAAPTGLIPCPTLSIVTGLSLVLGGLSTAWRILLSGAGAFYGLVGALYLGVGIDAVLLFGALWILLSSRSG